MRKATEKDYTAVREKTLPFATAMREKVCTAELKDHGGTSSIKMRWDLNPDAIRDRVFTLEINGQLAYIDLEELLSYTRLV